MTPWLQNYDPFANPLLSTLVASLPIVFLLAAIAWLNLKVHLAALLALALATAVAIFAFHMPTATTLAAAGFGAAYGLFPIGWIVLNLLFLYQITVDLGLFATLRSHLAQLAPDPRIQLVLIAFSFGAFFEGAAGFGTPVAVTSAILIQLGFKPLQAASLSLIANTAPVAFGALGTPILALSGVSGIDPLALSAMVGRQLPFFSLLVPFWVVAAYSGLRGLRGVWPACLTAGLAFSIPQFLISNFHGPWLVDIVSSISSILALILLLKFWQPSHLHTPENLPTQTPPHPTSPDLHPTSLPSSTSLSSALLKRAGFPWILLSLIVFLWGIPKCKSTLDSLYSTSLPIPHLHLTTARSFPVAPLPTPSHPTPPEPALFKLNPLSATGSGILLAAILSGLTLGLSPAALARIYLSTLHRIRFSLITIAAMLALGYVTKYSGTDATLGLALAKTGPFYPFFGTLLGWLGVALTGSDTSSNVIFGSLQKITSEQLGIAPVLMCAANSSGGVMGKMIDAQSIVVASTATGSYGEEGHILRSVFFHSLALASLVGLLVYLQSTLFPFTQMVVK